MDCEHQMLNIIARLDHNGYYTAQLEKKAAAQGEDASALSGPMASKTSTKSSSSLLSASAENVAGDVPSTSAQMRSAASLDQLPGSSRGTKSSAKPTSLPDLSDSKGTRK